MACSKNVSNPSPECFGDAEAFIMEKNTKLHKEKVLFSKVPSNYFLIHFYILYLDCGTKNWINLVLRSVSMNTLTVMVNLWWCFSLPFFLPLLPHSSLCLSPWFFSAVASQDQAIVADRRRVGSINRNWTNYKADVPLYDGGRTLSGGGGVGWRVGSGGCLWYFLYLSKLLFSVFFFSSPSPSLSLTVSFLWLCLAFSSPLSSRFLIEHLPQLSIFI